MTDQLLIPALIAVSGVVLLAYGLYKRGRAASYKATPCRPIGELVGGERQFISGKAHSPVVVTAPVSKKNCVYYLEKIDQKEQHHSSTGASHSSWERRFNNSYGGFFVRDGSGTALVVPNSWSVDFQKPETEESDDMLLSGGTDTTRKMEAILCEDEAVTALGTPRSLAEFMAYLRQDAQLAMHPDFTAELVKLEKEGGSALPCFFGDGAEKVADLAYADYVAGTASSAALLLQLGALLTAVGTAAVLYTLRVF